MTDDVSDVSADKPPFDPSKPFTPVAAAAGGDKPPFDPTKPFKPVEQPPGPMTGSDVASGVVENFIPSAKQFGSDVVRPIMHPIETATNLKDLTLGLLEKSGAIGTIFPSAGGGHEQYADAMGQYLKDRYGGWENIKRSVAKDPVGVLSDASMILSGGETAAGRLPGILGTTGRAMGTVGRAVDPLMAPVNAAKLATQGVGHFATHTGPEALQNAYRTGVEGGDAAEVLRDNMRGNVPTSNVVDIARQGVSEMAKDRAQQYVSDMAAIGKRPEIMDWDKVTEALQKNATVKKFEGIDISPETAAVRDRITSAIEKWGELPPDIYHTAAGFDALKQMIGEMRDAQPYGTPGRNVADRAYNAIRAEIIKQAPEYAKAMKNYSEASDLIREMNTTLSLRPGTSIDTSLRKLQSIMRNNVNTNYGRRMELGQLLEENGATHLMAALSGQALNTWAPRGLGKYVAGSTLPAIGAGLSSGHVLPAIGAAAVLPFMSPRLMGEGAHFIGRTVGRALDRSGQALSGIGGNRALGNLLYRAGRTANPEEGQYRTGGRIAPRAFRPRRIRKAGGGELTGDEDYDPVTGVKIGADVSDTAAPDPQSGLSRALSRLTGTQFGEPRQQLWPEKLVRSGVSLVGDILSGEQPMLPAGIRREDVTDIPPPSAPTEDSTWLGRQLGIAPVAAQPNDPAYERVQDMAGLAGGQTLMTGARGVAEAAAGTGRNLRVFGQQLASDPEAVGAPLSAVEHAPTFYSHLEKTVEAAPMEKATGEQWLGTLANKGVKKEELEHSGTLDFLTQNADRPVTKAEVAEHVGANKLELGEVNKGYTEDVTQNPRWQKLMAENDALAREHDELRQGRQWAASSPRGQRLAQIVDEMDANHDLMRAMETQSEPTRYQSYQLPGGENYRERLLTLPTPNDRYIAAVDRLKAKYGDMPLGQMPMTDAERTFIDKQINAYGDNGGTYTSGHWPGEQNPVVHRRSNERDVTGAGEDQSFKLRNVNSGNTTKAFPTEAAALAHLDTLPENLRPNLEVVPAGQMSKRALHMEEIQSDWHQQGRRQGYKGDVDVAALERQANVSYQNLVAEMRKNQPNVSKQTIGNLAMDLIDKIRDGEHPGSFYTPQERELGQKWHDDMAAYTQASHDNMTKNKVPDAPFKKNWHELALKDAIREAAEKGLDRISWTPGAAQADRYSLAQHLQGVTVVRDGDKIVWWPKDKNGNAAGTVTTDLSGKITRANEQYGQINGKGIDEVFGKEFADKVMKDMTPDDARLAKAKDDLNAFKDRIRSQSRGKTELTPEERLEYERLLDASRGSIARAEKKYSGLDLHVGGEGMKGFYDKMLPDAMNKIGKPHGVQVQRGEIGKNVTGRVEPQESLMAGRESFKVVWPDGTFSGGYSREAAEALAARGKGAAQPVHYMDIPPSLKQQALTKGFPLFEDSATAGAPLSALEKAGAAAAPAEEAAAKVKPVTVKADEAQKTFRKATGRDYGSNANDLPLLGRGDITLPPGMTMAKFKKEVDQKVADVKQWNNPQRRFWYENSGEAIHEATGRDPEMSDRVTFGVAKTSQGTPVLDNAAYTARGHGQMMVGEPIKTGRFPNEMGPHIEGAYRTQESGAVGPKISGYQSGFRTSWDPNMLNAGANDIHNMRWLGWDNFEGKPTTGQHNYDRMLRSAVTNKLNSEGFDGGGWKPGQVQAVGWAKTRAAGGVPEAEAGYDIANAFKDRTARMTYESAPGMTTGHLPEYHDAPFAVKQEYHDAINKILQDEHGRDVIASHMGLLTLPSEHGLGVYQSKVSPGTHARVITGQSPGGWKSGIDPATRELMDASELVRGTLLQQDAVAYHFPHFPKNGLTWDTRNLFDVRTGHPMTLPEAKVISGALEKATGSDFFSPVFTDQGYRFLNVPEYSGVSNQQLGSLLEKLTPSDAKVVMGYNDGFYHANDWKDGGPNGYLDRLKTLRPDVQRRASELLATLGPRISAVDADFAKRFGWTENPGNRPWETNPAYQAHAQELSKVKPGQPPRPWEPDFGQKPFRPELISRATGGRIGNLIDSTLRAHHRRHLAEGGLASEVTALPPVAYAAPEPRGYTGPLPDVSTYTFGPGRPRIEGGVSLPALGGDISIRGNIQKRDDISPTEWAARLGYHRSF